MPIYEYRCTSCGFQKEYLQKINDPVMTVCPECEKHTLSKMITAAGFQLKGSGWYATDFRNPKPAAKSCGKEKSDTKTDTKTDAKPDAKSDGKTDTKSDGKSESKPEAISSGAGPSS